MRKLAVVLALASTALATPALARDKSWYVGIEGGAMIVEDIDYDIGATNNAASVDHDYGYDVDGVIGYDFGGFRVETEVGYKSATVDGYSSTLTTPRYNTAGAIVATPAGTYDYAGGKTSALSFMLNGLLDFGDDDGIQGFVGGGVGVARVKANYGLTTRGNFVDDSDTVFAWQGLAGVRAPLTDHIDATLKYRFFNADNVKLVDVTNRTFEGRFRSHSILGGVTYNFGSPTPPPPPPPADLPPPPPPAPAPVAEAPVCSPGPFIVFFEWDKSDITPEAASILDNAVSQYQSCGNAQVMLAGHADKSGSASYNVGLSQRRADSVKAYLTSHAIPDGVISTEAFGESRPRVDTADGVREVQNRRVEVTYGPGAGQ
ncbi:outer membrane protein OmpA-like peptidoglycan-associated protein/opacity protein-like surface antigen [Sphingomonas insulae]|uniref:OmpA family protein n=1 Tax=Sphingomonas insulae TaxID=424800 RepID=A0ABP3SP62_9SPHN|nr:OmpA family protein [Sphingomonas insulae]NIJ30406.1 outer membrane protein OmpA-like peptidoglycan-associated protein/opacity protein-like surface antigen [Sphingomonas insulae]